MPDMSYKLSNCIEVFWYPTVLEYGNWETMNLASFMNCKAFGNFTKILSTKVYEHIKVTFLS